MDDAGAHGGKQVDGAGAQHALSDIKEVNSSSDISKDISNHRDSVKSGSVDLDSIQVELPRDHVTTESNVTGGESVTVNSKCEYSKPDKGRVTAAFKSDDSMAPLDEYVLVHSTADGNVLVQNPDVDDVLVQSAVATVTDPIYGSIPSDWHRLVALDKK